MAEIKRPVFFSGENPGMTLYVPGTEQVVAVASYWYCTDSPYGVGHALVLWLTDETGNIGHGGIFTDNLDLAKVLVEKLTHYFPEFKDVSIDGLTYTETHCEHTYDGASYRVHCQAQNTKIELEWVEVLDRKQFIRPGFPTGTTTHDLTTTICPCKEGHIQVNGNAIEGKAQTFTAKDGFFRSSAFLAFAESWLGPFTQAEA